MWIGWTEFDVRLGDVHSLKTKRSIVRPIVAELQRSLPVSAAETDSVDLYQRAGIGISVVSGDHAHVADVLHRAEQVVLGHPEVQLLSSRTRIIRAEDIQ